MADTINSLEGLSVAAPAAPAAPVYVQKLDKLGRAYATGKRKNAIARVWVKPGSGKITVNGKDFNLFFARPVLQMILQQPIIAAARKDQYDVVATVSGGGLSGQAGAVTINQRSIEIYFARPVLRMLIQQPLVAANRNGQYDVVCTVSGGGLSGQAGAVRHGISKALTYYEPSLRPALKAAGFLTRDPRVVERKKYGRKKARRSFQFSKR